MASTSIFRDRVRIEVIKKEEALRLMVRGELNCQDYYWYEGMEAPSRLLSLMTSVRCLEEVGEVDRSPPFGRLDSVVRLRYVAPDYTWVISASQLAARRNRCQDFYLVEDLLARLGSHDQETHTLSDEVFSPEEVERSTDSLSVYEAYLRRKRRGGVNWEDEAFILLNRSAKLGYLRAKKDLADHYLAMKSYAKAFDLYGEASLSGCSESQFALGELYSDGIGCKPNHGLGIFWYREAARANVKDALLRLAFCFCEGNGVHVDELEAGALHNLARSSFRKVTMPSYPRQSNRTKEEHRAVFRRSLRKITEMSATSDCWSRTNVLYAEIQSAGSEEHAAAPEISIFRN